MLKLGVNIDHSATLREARYKGRTTGEPNPVEIALLCEQAGADGITAHLREDRRHIQDRDIFELRKNIKTRLNMEMANVPEIVEIALNVKPDNVCIVPERRLEITTEGGLDVLKQEDSLKKNITKLQNEGIIVSLFISPDGNQIEAAKRVGSQFIELHTGAFSDAATPQAEAAELERLIEAAKFAHSLGLKVNAGHGINYVNVHNILKVPYLCELNIGHTIIARSIAAGVCQAVKEMRDLIKNYSL